MQSDGGRERGSETAAAWDGRSRDKLSDTVELATESGFECPCGGDGEGKEGGKEGQGRREGGKEGRRAEADADDGGVRSRVRSSPVDVRGSIYKQKEEEDGGVRSGSGEEEESGDSLGCDCPLGGGKCWKDQKMRAPAPKTTVTQTIEGARKENRWMGKEQRRS